MVNFPANGLLKNALAIEKFKVAIHLPFDVCNLEFYLSLVLDFHITSNA